LGGAIGGTLAWLSTTTPAVKNTFTTSDISISLSESDDLDLKMVPGHSVTKDPIVKVDPKSEECFLFVKLEKSENFDNYLTFEVAEGWAVLDGNPNVYYRKVLKADMGTDFVILKDNQVKVKEDVTKAMMNELGEATFPSLTVTAYASQLHKDNSNDFDVAAAWGNIS
ncbi:MAG: hypothetical protein Q4E22_05655, partial [Coriobacteriia bacterium]|nr:hypothetical protein [Coriobacteriia bacterium]